MGAGGAVEEQGVGLGDGHVEGADGGLAVDEGDVAAVNGGRVVELQRLARVVVGALRHGVVPVAELELDDVAHRGRHRVRHERVLRSADHYGDYPVRGLDCFVR